MRGLRPAVVIALAAGGVRAGDPDVADLLLKKARKAFAAKSYEDAEQAFRRALQEMTPFPDARLGLGETLEKLGKPAEALDACQKCVKEIEEAGDPPKWKSTKTRAQQAIARLQGRQGDIAKLNEAFVRRCLDFGRKVAGSDPALARKAFDTVLLIDPSNEAAKSALKQLPQAGAAAPAPPPEEKPKAERFGESVLHGELWSGAPEWSVGKDAIACDAPTEGKLLWLSEMPLAGRYGVRGRFRMTGTAEKYSIGVFLGGDGHEPWWGLFIGKSGAVSFRRCEAETDHVKKDLILDSFDPKAWHTLEIDVQPGDVTVILDEKTLFEHNESNRKTFDGNLCLFVQHARVDWTDLEVKR